MYFVSSLNSIFSEMALMHHLLERQQRARHSSSFRGNRPSYPILNGGRFSGGMAGYRTCPCCYPLTNTRPHLREGSRRHPLLSFLYVALIVSGRHVVAALPMCCTLNVLDTERSVFGLSNAPLQAFVTWRNVLLALLVEGKNGLGMTRFRILAISRPRYNAGGSRVIHPCVHLSTACNKQIYMGTTHGHVLLP